MSINVYWSYVDDEWMRVKEPQPVLKDLYERRYHESNPLSGYHKCPFVSEGLKNVFSLHSPYDYSFSVKNENINTSMYDQNFFDRHVIVRSAEKKFFSFMMPFVFFTEEKSLEITVPMFPHMENNNITKRCMPFQGTIDIGKYFRNIDFAFFLKDPYEEFIIKENEVFGYIKFNTNKKIKFTKFQTTPKLNNYLIDMKKSLDHRDFSFRKVSEYYNNFSIKKNVLKEIKSNLVE